MNRSFCHYFLCPPLRHNFIIVILNKINFFITPRNDFFSLNRNVLMADSALVQHQRATSVPQADHAWMALFLYPQLNVTEELTVLLELEFVMHVLWEHMLGVELHSVPLVLQGTHVMTPVSLLCPAPLHNIGTTVARYSYLVEHFSTNGIFFFGLHSVMVSYASSAPRKCNKY